MAAGDRDVLEAHGIEAVVNCCTAVQMPNFFEGIQSRMAEQRGGEQASGGAAGRRDTVAPLPQPRPIRYHRFPISHWRSDVRSAPPLWEAAAAADRAGCPAKLRHAFDMKTAAGVLGYFDAPYAFAARALAAGSSVLVHCAGEMGAQRL